MFRSRYSSDSTVHQFCAEKMMEKMMEKVTKMMEEVTNMMGTVTKNDGKK